MEFTEHMLGPVMGCADGALLLTSYSHVSLEEPMKCFN